MPGGAIVLQSAVETGTEIVTQLLGLAILAGTLAAIVALAYRWSVRERAPRILALLVGLAGVAVYLTAAVAVGATVLDSATPTEEALLNMVTFLSGAAGSLAGREAGDRFGTDVVLAETSEQAADGPGAVAQHLGRVTSVELPGEIDDVVGYDPVPEATAEALAGKRFVFPGNITVPELRERLVSRIKEDYAVGHVDVELGADGSVEHIGLGSRAAGIGPTLPPATNAVAVRADPAFSASAGDLVQVWETDPMRRVLTGELRGVADDVVTIAIDASDTPKVDPTREYRLVTLPVEDRPEREFASLLRAAPETFSSVTVEAGSPLHGMPVGALDVAVVAVKPEAAESDPLPASSTLLAPGDTVFAIARPEALRRLRTAADPLDPSLVRDVGRPSVGASEQSSTDATPEPAEAGDTPETGAATAESEADDLADVDLGVEAGSDEGPTPEPAEAGGEGPTPEPAEVGGESDIAEAESGPAGGDGTGASEDGTATAGGSSFDELKDEFESGDADWDDESATAEDTTDEGGTASFQELKEDFESGNAEWDEEGSAASEGLEDLDVPADSVADESGMDDLDGIDLDEEEGESDAIGPGDDTLDDLPVQNDEDDDLSDLSFDEDDSGDDDLSDLSFDEDDSGDDDLSDLSFDEDDSGDDDLSDLSFDEDDSGDDDLSGLSREDDDEDLFGDDEAVFEDEDSENEETDDEDSEDDDDDDDDDDGGGGGTSFAQLKEEFESGDADWEDDISDSPGGDMRLDE